jgi:hypothetical protein
MWTFSITDGKWYSPSGTFVSKGYAGGNLGHNPEGVDNPDDEGIKDVGPLPEGWYTFGEPVQHSKLGTFAIPLIPDPSNDMKGRAGFFLHGDTTPPGNASEGCIVQPYMTRYATWTSPDHRLQVVRTFEPVTALC